LEATQVAFPDFNFKVTIDFNFKLTMESQYLGSFIGADTALCSWLHGKTKNWEEAVADLAVVTPNFP
jgi:hypothetical protein